MRETSLKMVHELAKKDPRVVFVGSDLGAGALACYAKAIEINGSNADAWYNRGFAYQQKKMMEQALESWQAMPDGTPDGHSLCRLIESFPEEAACPNAPHRQQR